MANFIKETFIIALGIVASGYFVDKGLSSFADKNRTVNVKGLSEKVVTADKVTWPLVYKNIGNDLSALYNDIKNSNEIIVEYLKSKGIEDSEINLNAPEIIDMKAERYSSTPSQYRYNVTTIVTVTSSKVDVVRKLITEQGEFLKKGIAIVSGDYQHVVRYEYTSLNDIKPQMIEEATKNARQAAEKFAKDSDSKLGKIMQANQGQFSIVDEDATTPYLKRVRVVTTVNYALED